jgi:hypothetical protein
VSEALMVERLRGVRNGKGKGGRSKPASADQSGKRAQAWRSEKALSGKAEALNPPKQYQAAGTESAELGNRSEGDKASWRTARIGGPGAESGIPTIPAVTVNSSRGSTALPGRSGQQHSSGQ